MIDTHTLTDTQTWAMTTLEGQNWPRVKTMHYSHEILHAWNSVWFNMTQNLVKGLFRGPRFLRTRGHYFKKNCTYLVYLCLREQVGDMIVNGWPQFECNLNVFVDMILPYGSHCINMTASPEPINGATGAWLSCLATCEWLRALMRLHYDVMISMSTSKTWWSCIGGRLTMLTEENLLPKYNVNEMNSI